MTAALNRSVARSGSARKYRPGDHASSYKEIEHENIKDFYRASWRAVFAGLAASFFLCGADDAKQKVDAKGLTFEAPASWKSSPPTRQMRRAELKVEPIDGDDFPAELVVFVFPGGVGSVQANIERWKNQFKDKDGNPPKVETKKVKGKNVEVTRVETSGHYHPAQFPGSRRSPIEPTPGYLGRSW